MYLKEGLDYYIDALSRGDIKGYARQGKLAKQALYNMRDKALWPQLSSILRLCYETGIEPVPFINNGTISIDPERREKIQAKKDPHVKASRKPFPIERIRFILEVVLLANEKPVPSMREVANRLGYSPAQIAQHLPELSSKISARYLAYVQARRSARMNKLGKEIVTATLAAFEEKQSMSILQTAKYLSHPGLLRSPELRAIWRGIRAEIEGGASSRDNLQENTY
jgi:hypothetical protein